MRPEDRRWITVGTTYSTEEPVELPLDAELQGVARELAESGARARLGLAGRTQPTNTFRAALRSRLLARYEPGESHS